MMSNGWYQPPQPVQTNTSQGVFTAFVESEQAAQNYPVPINGMAVLIDIQDGKMWLKSVASNGIPAPVRTFTIKEIPMAVPAGADVVTKEELNKSLADLEARLLEAVKGLNNQKGDVVK